MSRTLLIIALILANQAISAPSEDVNRYRDHFESQALPYAQPRACGADAACSIVADFNGDGEDDFAALYEYVGPTNRRAARSIDLVIVYSQEGSTELAHAMFTHVAHVSQDKRASASLTVQATGPMPIPIGEFVLESPGINIVFTKSRSHHQNTTLYWRGDGFYAVDKSTD